MLKLSKPVMRQMLTVSLPPGSTLSATSSRSSAQQVQPTDQVQTLHIRNTRPVTFAPRQEAMRAVMLLHHTTSYAVCLWQQRSLVRLLDGDSDGDSDSDSNSNSNAHSNGHSNSNAHSNGRSHSDLTMIGTLCFSRSAEQALFRTPKFAELSAAMTS